MGICIWFAALWPMSGAFGLWYINRRLRERYPRGMAASERWYHPERPVQSWMTAIACGPILALMAFALLG